MACSTRGFGAPVTDAGGNVARTSVPVPTPGRSWPVTVETRCQSPGWGSGAHSAGTATDPFLVSSLGINTQFTLIVDATRGSTVTLQRMTPSRLTPVLNLQ